MILDTLGDFLHAWSLLIARALHFLFDHQHHAS